MCFPEHAVYFILVGVGYKHVMWAYAVMLKAAGHRSYCQRSSGLCSCSLPRVRWVCCGEEGSLLSKQSLNGDSHDIVSPVGHRVILECRPLRQLTRGLVSENRLGSSVGALCECFSDRFWCSSGLLGLLSGSRTFSLAKTFYGNVGCHGLLCNQWSFNPIVAQSTGRDLKLNSVIGIEKSLRKKMRTFSVWKVPAMCYLLPNFFYHFCWAQNYGWGKPKWEDCVDIMWYLPLTYTHRRACTPTM